MSTPPPEGSSAVPVEPSKHHSDLLGAQRAVWASSLTSTEKLVALAILSHWSRSEQAPWPGVERLARLTSLGRRAVMTAIKSLEKKGVIGVSRQSGQSNTYDLSAIFAGRLPVHDDHRCTTITGDPGALDPCTTITPPVHDDHATSARRAPEEIQEGIQEETHEGIGRSTARRVRRWTRVPATWSGPNEQHRQAALAHGLDLELEEQRFRNHEFASPKSDPDATFLNWLTNGFGQRARRRPTDHGVDLVARQRQMEAEEQAEESARRAGSEAARGRSPGRSPHRPPDAGATGWEGYDAEQEQAGLIARDGRVPSD